MTTLSYGLLQHDLQAHSDQRLYNAKTSITRPSDISACGVYSFGTYKFLSRDLLTLETNGFPITPDDDTNAIEDMPRAPGYIKMKTDLDPSAFPPLDTFYCDFYRKGDKTSIVPIYTGADLYREELIPGTDLFSVGDELELSIAPQACGLRVRDIPPKVHVIVRWFVIGTFIDTDTLASKKSDNCGLVQFQILSSEVPFAPLLYMVPHRKGRFSKKRKTS